MQSLWLCLPLLPPIRGWWWQLVSLVFTPKKKKKEKKKMWLQTIQSHRTRFGVYIIIKVVEDLEKQATSHTAMRKTWSGFSRTSFQKVLRAYKQYITAIDILGKVLPYRSLGLVVETQVAHQLLLFNHIQYFLPCLSKRKSDGCRVFLVWSMTMTPFFYFIFF